MRCAALIFAAVLTVSCSAANEDADTMGVAETATNTLKPDADGDGYVTFQEFQETFEGNNFDLQVDGQLKALFDSYDQNADGRLETAELGLRSEEDQ